LADYRDHYDAIRAAGADLVVVSVDTPAQSETLRRDLALPFTILADADRRVVQEWGLYNPREHGGIAKPAAFIIDRDRCVRHVQVDTVARRAHASEIIGLLRRPDVVPRRRVYIPHLTDIVRSVRNMVRH
jgi:peroxiredoxin Q/BCP